MLSDGINYYIYGPGTTPVEQYDPSVNYPPENPYFINFSPTDSFYTYTNTSGNYEQFYAFDAYGAVSGAYETSMSDNAFGFAGQYFDPSGTYDMRARYYDPSTGEFTTADPDLAQTDQAYEYAEDDPVNESDPSGQWTHGYCLSGTASTFYGTTGAPGARNVSTSAMACLVEDDHSNVALVTSSTFANVHDSSVSDVVSQYLSAGLASAQVSFDDFNTNANTVFAGLRGEWQTVGGGATLEGFFGISGEAMSNSATNGSGFLYGAGIGVGVPGGLPIAFSSAGLQLNSDRIPGTQIGRVKDLIATLDSLSNPGVAWVGEDGVPRWLYPYLGLGGFPSNLGQTPPPYIQPVSYTSGSSICDDGLTVIGV